MPLSSRTSVPPLPVPAFGRPYSPWSRSPPDPAPGADPAADPAARSRPSGRGRRWPRTNRAPSTSTASPFAPSTARVSPSIAPWSCWCADAVAGGGTGAGPPDPPDPPDLPAVNDSDPATSPPRVTTWYVTTCRPAAVIVTGWVTVPPEIAGGPPRSAPDTATCASATGAVKVSVTAAGE